MEDYQVSFPDEHFTLVEGESEGQLVTVLANDSLVDFEHKFLFPWRLSIRFTFPERDSGTPTQTESNQLNEYEDFLIDGLKASDEKPNALFIATRTGNDVKCIKLQIHEAEVAHSFLQKVCESNDTPFPMDYEMEHDEDWGEANGFLELTKAPPA